MCEGKPGTVRLGKDIAARVRSEHCACHRPSIIISRAAFIENSIKLMLKGIHLPPTPLVCCEDLGDDLQGQALPQVGGQCEWGRQLSCWCRRCFSIRSCFVLEVVPFFGCFKHANSSNIMIIELNQIKPKDANAMRNLRQLDRPGWRRSSAGWHLLSAGNLPCPGNLPGNTKMKYLLAGPTAPTVDCCPA